MKIIILSMIPVGIFTGAYLYLMLRRAFTAFGIDVSKTPVKAGLLSVSALLAVAACFFRKVWALAMYYVVAADLILRLGDLIARKVLKGEKKEAYEKSGARKWLYLSGIVPLIVSASLMITGWMNMRNIVPTEYAVETEKEVRTDGYRVVLIADSHYGTSAHYEEVLIKCAEIEDTHPDLVILAGDIVDESTKPEEVAEIFDAFGGIQSTYGTFFVWGNHDRSSSALKTEFGEDYLRDVIKENGIRILEEDTFEIGDDLLLVGREDYYEYKKGKPRKPMAELMQGADLSRFVICIDHQPCAFAEEAEAGADLILCGHTHGGQIWPAGEVEEIMKLNDGVYGRYEAGRTTAIVTSGFGGWAWPVRNETPSEYVIVKISGQR